MMKNIFLGLFLMMSFFSMAQTPLFTENFEGPTISMTSTGTGTNNWGINTNYHSEGLKSDTCTYATSDTIYLVSNVFSTLGSQIAFLEFDHIAKIELFDKAGIEVSNDNGTTWAPLTTTQYMGAGSFYNDMFNESSYATDWDGGIASTPDSTWWKSEKFDISALVANSSQVKIRFVLIDLNANGTGGKYGWILDNIRVWKPYNQEAALLSYRLPYSMSSGCGLNNEIIQVSILNAGATAINGNLSASFKREGQSAVTENISNIIAPGDTLVYTFANTIDLYSSVDTIYEVQTWINLTNDVISNNDSLIDSLVSRTPLAEPVINDTTIPFATNVLLHATHNEQLTWFSDPLGNNQIGSGEYYNTPLLYDTSIFYVQGEKNQLADLTTTFANNSQSTGNMFDIKAYNTLTIDSFYINGTSNALMEVWYRPGSYVGYNTSNAGWTKLGQYTVTSQGAGVPTLLPIGGLTIPAGQTYGICITYVSGSIKYTTGNGTNHIHQDTNMKITCGHGGGYFNYTNTVRVWNGKVHYHVGDIACPSIIKEVTVNVSGIPNNNAGLVSVQPNGIFAFNSVQPIIVDLINSGTDTLKKCNIYYEINDSIYSPITWTGNLAYDSIESITLDSLLINSSVFRIKAWTTMPNDSVDESMHNDTLKSTVYSCLSGSFTLGTPNGDFPDFASLKTQLEDAGLCGNTVINILPGIYTEQFDFTQYPGLSSSSRLTFQSSTGVASDVIFQYAAISAVDNYVIKFDSASYITLKDITVKALGLTYGKAIVVTNGSDYNIIDNNILSSNSIAQDGRVIEITGGTNSSYNTVSNNQLIGGYYGIYTEGTSSADLAIENVFVNNSITEYELYGAYIYNQKILEFKNNIIRNRISTVNKIGVRFYRCKGSTIDGNDVIITASSSKNAYGIYLYYCDSTPSVRGRVSNNMIITKGSTGYHYCIYYYYGNGHDILYNSLYNESGNSSSAMLKLYNSSNSYAGQSIYNNSIFNNGIGYNIYVRNNARLIGADNNNIYGPNASIFAYWDGNRASFAALKAAYPKNNQNSISVNPGYLSTSDLHTKSSDLDAAAVPFPALVNHDFDGQIRDSISSDIGADEFTILNEDVGVSNLISPTISCPGDTANVIVEITSQGVDTLFNYVINWKVDGVLQTPINCTDTLLFGQTSIKQIGTYAFAAGAAHTLEFWTTMPNGTADLNTSNDSLSTTFKTSLSAGTYTIGGVNPDYQNFTQVADELNLAGICGPVVFDVATGTYGEHISLENVYGLSSVNTITFKSQSGDSSDVILSYFSNSANTNYVVLLNGVQNITFEDLTLQSTSSSYSNVLVLKNKTNHLAVRNCVIKNTIPETGTTSLDERNLVHSTDSVGIGMEFTNNAFINGNIGLWLNGGFQEKINWIVRNNVFTNNAAASIKIAKASSCVVESNLISNTLVSIDYFHAISVNTSADSIKVLKNKIDIVANATCQALSVTNSIGDPTTPILVANNFVHVNQVAGIGWGAGIQANESKNISILYNSVYITGNQSNSAAFQVENAATSNTDNLKLANNIFASAVQGGSIYRFVQCNYSSITNDYNTLFNGATGFISGSINTLSNWQMASSDAAHSNTYNPYFTSSTDLHVNNNILNGIAMPVVEVVDDIDNEIRNSSSPDIGADEFNPSPIDVAILSVVNPQSGCGLSSTEAVTIMIKNIGSIPISSGLTATLKFGTSLPITETISNTIASGDTLLYTFSATVNLNVNNYAMDSAFQIRAWTALTGDPVQFNDTVTSTINSNYIPPVPTIVDINAIYASSTSLSATSTYSVSWFKADSITLLLSGNNTYQTPLLYDTTQYWLTANTSNCSSPMTGVTVNITGYPTTDAGISSIVSPNSNVAYNTSQILQVKLHNYGINTLNTSYIYWTINGVQDSILWNGSLTHGQSAIVDVDTTSFIGGLYQFNAWTSLPNNIVDIINTNDTVTSSFQVCLTGTYTIGHTTSSSNFDFNSITAAKNALVSSGICGPVTFTIAPGIYVENIVFPAISGANANNRITFTSTTSDSNDVNLSYSLSSVNTWVAKITGDYYTFSNITLSSLGSSSYGRVIELANGATYNEFLNCVIEGTITTSTSSTYAVIYSNGGSNQYNTFNNNLILNGSYAFYLYGYGNNTQKGNKILNNTIKGFVYGVYFVYQKYLEFSGNTVESGSSSTNYGLRLKYCDQITVTKNKIDIEASSTFYGIYYLSCNGIGTNNSLIANNFISVSGAGSATGHGIRSYSSSFTKYYNNSINLLGGGGSTAAFYLYGGTINSIINNVLVNSGGEYAYYIGTLSAIAVSDYNNIYNSTGELGYYQGDKSSLQTFKAATGKDIHSLSVDPLFYSPTDLHSISKGINNLGTPLADITEDIDGETRSITYPDIGADEFSIPANDASIVSIVSPTTPVNTGNNAVLVDMRNLGSAALTSVNIAWEVNSIPQTSFAWTGSLLNGATASAVNIGSYNFTTGANNLKIWTENPNSSIDGNKQNDTIRETLLSCNGALNGAYTIGGSNPDYTTIESAIMSLKYCGVSSHVVFNIAPGTYNEQIRIQAIPGASSTATITFQSTTLDSSDVTISYNSNATNNYIWYMDGADWITLKNITIVATNTINGRALVLKNGASNNSFIGNIIQGSNGTTASCVTIYSDDDNDNNNTFRFNHIQNGYYAVYMEGSSSSNHETGLIFEYNIISDYYFYGAYFYYSDSLIFNHNAITNSSTSSHGYGFYLKESDGGSIISNNKIISNSSGSSNGISLYDCNANSASISRVFNNFVSVVTNAGNSKGIRMSDCSYQEIANNNVFLKTPTLSAAALSIDDGTHNKVLNNCLVLDGYGNAMVVSNSNTLVECDYNNYYSTGGVIISYNGISFNNLIAHQSYSNKDFNSFSVNPNYSSITDLHVSASSLNGKATPISWVPTDIDGEPRDTTTPDIGADEFVPAPRDVEVVEIIYPSQPFALIGDSHTVRALIKNKGTDTLYSIPMAYIYATNAAITQTLVDTLYPDDTTSLLFTVPFTVQQGNLELTVYSALTGDGNNFDDTIQMNFGGMSLISPTHCDDFEGLNTWVQTSPQWELGMPNGSIIDTTHSGVNAWATGLTANYKDNANEFLYSPYFDFSSVVNNATLSFWRNNVFTSNDGFSIEYSINGGSTWILVGTIGDTSGTNWYNTQYNGNHFFGNNSNGWIQSTYNLAALNQTPTPVQFRFRLLSDGSGNSNGVAIDDFCISVIPVAIDVGVISIDSPVDSTQIGVSTNTVSITVKNYGDSIQYTIPVNYQVANNAMVYDTIQIVGGLASDSTIQFTFSQNFQSPMSDYLLCASTSLATDNFSSNDQTCKNIFTKTPNYDFAATMILSPIDTVSLAPQEVRVRIKNMGLLPISSCDVKYTISPTGYSATETWTGTALAQGDSADFTFAQKFNPPTNSYIVCAKTLLTNDAIPSNDETCVTVVSVGIDDLQEQQLVLWQNVPNPANGITSIQYEIPKAGIVQFQLVNAYGQLIQTMEENKSNGRHSIEIDTKKMASGTYYYSMVFNGQRITKKLLIIK